MVSQPTLSEGTAGGIEPKSVTFPICQHYVDRWISVTEEEIKSAMQFMLRVHHKVVEGAAGVSVAAYRKYAEEFAGKNSVIVICGGNLGMDVLRDIVITS